MTPMMPIQTPQLILRPMQPKEVGVLREMLKVEDIRVEFTSIAALGPSDLQANIATRLTDPEHAAHPWLWIIDQASAEILGFFLVRDYKTPRSVKQLYYAIRPSARGRGVAAEALDGLAQHFLQTENTSVVFVRGEALNEASRKTAQAANFKIIDAWPFPGIFSAYAGDMNQVDAKRLIDSLLMQPSR